MSKEQIIEIFENIVRLLELKGENQFKIKAYTSAIKALESAPNNLEKLVEDGEIQTLSGIGKSTGDKISELVRTGQLPYYDKLKAEFPAGILDLFKLRGLGPQRIKLLWNELKVDSIEKLKDACESGKAAKLPRFGDKTAKSILESIAHLEKYKDTFLLGEVTPWVEQITAALKASQHAKIVEPAGSFRRKKEVVHDLDFIVASNKPEAISEIFVKLPEVEKILLSGDTKSSVILKSGIQCDLRVVTPEEFPFAIAYFTGSKEHNVHVRARALAKGLSLNEYTFSYADNNKATGPLPQIKTEEDIYKALGMEYVPPELRENTGEVEASEINKLPNLIILPNIRGVVHNHTNASDGHATTLEMATAAKNLGLEYLGIADHSKASFQANGLSVERLEAQIQDIRSSSFPIPILIGTECDILKDGSLDFEDSVLAKLDYVVASVHSSFTLSAEEMTARIIKAMRNKYVSILAHPTGRLLLQREPYQLKISEILDAAAETNTILEINANPNRLDLDWRYLHEAKKRGIKFVISPDAHTPEGLADYKYGVSIARKGWLEPEDIINTMSYSELKKTLRQKLA